MNVYSEIPKPALVLQFHFYAFTFKGETQVHILVVFWDVIVLSSSWSLNGGLQQMPLLSTSSS